MTTFSFYFILEPRKDNKTDSSNGNAMSPQEQQQQHQQQQHQQQQHAMMQAIHDRGESMNKPERPNSLGPKLSKRINFYHGEFNLL
jgi:hypothetical protein